jgi:D-3-phosphoglycerate dehydrogenase / 2-oxoglutarate reductase
MLSESVRLRIAILSPIWPASVVQLEISHDVELALTASAAELADIVSQVDVVVMRSGINLDQSVLKRTRRLRLIIRAGVGLDNIDLEAARQRNIRVISIPLSVDAVAEHIFGLAIAISRRLLEQHKAMADGRWEKHAGHLQSLFGRRLGLIGFGRIGQRAAELGRAFRMEVLAYDRSPEKAGKQAAARALEVKLVDFHTLLAEADVVTLQTPLNEASHHMLNATSLAVMKCEAILINVGRGGLVDEKALFAALNDGQIAGAALDVFDPEPPSNNPLFTLPNFLGTPHVAAQTVQAQSQVGEAVVKLVNAFAVGADWSHYGTVVV